MIATELSSRAGAAVQIKAPRRVLLLTTSLTRGGAEAVVVELARFLRLRGWEVSVASMLPPDTYVETLEAAGVEVISLGMRRHRLNIVGTARLFRYLLMFKPELVHGHMFHASILTRLASGLLKVPAVCTIHTTVDSSQRSDSARLREWAYRLTDRLCLRTTAVSKIAYQRCIREAIVPANRIRLIPNGVDCQRFHADPALRNRKRLEMGWSIGFTWLCVARLERAKDFPTLIRSFRDVQGAFPESRLVIAGEGSLREQIEGLIAEAGLNRSITLLGMRPDVPELMNACDALVMSSYSEGGPLVLLEAAACGRPVVATEVGAATEIVAPGHTGMLVPPRQPRVLAGAMRELMSNSPERLDQMGSCARDHVSNRFSQEITLQMYVGLYEELLESRRGFAKP